MAFMQLVIISCLLCCWWC